MGSEYQSADDIFECRLCGECCNGFGGTYVTSLDIRRISKFIGSDPDSFIQKYCDPSGSRHVLTQGTDGSCVFFDPEKQCTIHPVKPRMCRTWPYLATIIKNPENWNAMASACPGMKKHIPHRDLARIIATEQKRLDNSG